MTPGVPIERTERLPIQTTKAYLTLAPNAQGCSMKSAHLPLTRISLQAITFSTPLTVAEGENTKLNFGQLT